MDRVAAAQGNDGSMVDRLRAGDAAARREMFAQWHPWLRGYLRSRVDAGDVDDLAGEVIIRALEGLRNGQRPEVFGAWLTGIARNVVKRWYDQKEHRPTALPEELPQRPTDPQLELDRTDLPDQPADLVFQLSRQHLWSTVLDAARGLDGDMAVIMGEHLRQAGQHRWVVGTELARAVGRPVDVVNRQFNRSHRRMRDLVTALMIARTGQGDCAALVGLLRPEQRLRPNGLVLDAAQARRVLKHAKACRACAPRARQASDLSRWALGPGLVGLADDDDERRRAIAGLFLRTGEAPALGAVPAPLTLADVRAVDRVRAALPRFDGLVRFVQEHPDLVQRVVAAAGGAAAAATIVLAVLAQDHRDLADPPPRDLPVVDTVDTVDTVGTTTAPPPATGGTPIPFAPVAVTTSTGTGVAAPTPAPATTTTPAANAPVVSTTEAATTQPSIPMTTAAPNSPQPTTAPAAPAAKAVTIDVTGLSYETFTVSGQAGVLNAHNTHELKLAPGPHTLTVSAGPKVAFQVTQDNRVEYDPSLEGTLTGAGTPSLVVHGHRVTLNTDDVSYYNVTVTGTGWPTASTRSRYLLPGKHAMVFPAGKQLPFTVTGNGQVTYDHSLDTLLTGRDTSTLAVHGYQITLDTRELSYANTTVSGTGWPAYNPVGTRRLVPGSYTLNGMNGNTVPFTVTDDGTVAYDSTMDRILTGAGTSTLTAHGLPVTVDYTDLDGTNATLDGAGWPVPQKVRTFRMLPGKQNFRTAGGQFVPFVLAADGRIDYDTSANSLLTGRGGNTLVVHGYRITLDVRDISYYNAMVAGVAFTTPAPTHVVRLLPGRQSVLTTNGNAVPFVVTGTGQIDYDAGLGGILTGAGTGTIALHGFPITIDATATGRSTVLVGGVGTMDARSAHTVKLLPGKHILNDSSFQVTDGGRVDFPAGLDGLFSGRGSSTLVVRR
ncbi:RNA polymerase sigma factor [Actinokineospora inagensis]|uniref:RNA polymerase sigma factor n=1 Tax=Actinokineospora inagensis TaxID=103730 RepID=UPI00042585DF|nr:RNA polymerase sigma factor [Actinokineospora inagensis]